MSEILTLGWWRPAQGLKTAHNAAFRCEDYNTFRAHPDPVRILTPDWWCALQGLKTAHKAACAGERYLPPSTLCPRKPKL